MESWFWCQAKFVLGGNFLCTLPLRDAERDYRAALCRFEDDLFARYRDGHRILGEAEASALIATVFTACGRAVPDLDLVDGFDDPRVGGLADVEGNRIMIEKGCLYRFLVLHESAHLLVPTDHRHGPVFTYVLQMLYRTFIRVPEHVIREFLIRHELSSYTELPQDARIAA
jgi:hypothetical protein